MKIVVCVKRVPSTDTRVKIAPDGTSIDPSSVEWIISPYDEFALEGALQIKDEDPDTEVIVVSLASPEATKELRTCLAMGADRAIHIQADGGSDRDAQTTAVALSQVIQEENPHLVLCGKMAVDKDQGQVGILLAYQLGWPCLTEVCQFASKGDAVEAKRESGSGAMEIYEVPLPAVLTVTKGDTEPRYANLKGIMAAKKKPLEEKTDSGGDSSLTVRSMEMPAERSPGRIVGEGPDAVDELIRLLREEAKAI